MPSLGPSRLADRRNANYSYDPHSGWNAVCLSLEESRRLLALLTEAIPDPAGYELITDLQRRLEGSR